MSVCYCIIYLFIYFTIVVFLFFFRTLCDIFCMFLNDTILLRQTVLCCLNDHTDMFQKQK